MKTEQGRPQASAPGRLHHPPQKQPPPTDSRLAATRPGNKHAPKATGPDPPDRRPKKTKQLRKGVKDSSGA